MTSRSSRFTMSFADIERTQGAVVGGKAANLGELVRLDDIRVPPGFCVTTHAYARFVDSTSIEALFARLVSVRPDDLDEILTLSATIRRVLQAAPIPADVASEITKALTPLGTRRPYAVRSSATTEDLPTASFAGQHDSYLDIVGGPAILDHIRRCWASLFTERAVTYRTRNGIDHRSARMAVVVQRMLDADMSGVVFTADPVTSNRKVVSIEATRGLGEALVSGRVNTAIFRVRDGEIVDSATGVDRDRHAPPTLTDPQVLELARLGRRIEAHFGSPQDIEWCLADGAFHIVQSRPITTLFPIPPVDDTDNHVYISVGHQQMMTDPMKPLGLSLWQMTTPAPMAVAGGRLFVDVTDRLISPTHRDPLLEIAGRSDPLIRDALETIVARDGFLPHGRERDTGAPPGPVVGTVAEPIETDPSIVTKLIERTRASLDAARSGIRDESGVELFDFITDDLSELRRLLFDPLSHQAIMAGMEATWWLNDHIADWLGESNAADTLTQSAPNNVTSEMGLALLDVADAIRPHPDVVAYLETVDVDEDFLDGLAGVAGGPAARTAIEGYLDRYGMRCVGEIDITRPRWSERPAALLPTILGNVHNFEPGAGTRRFEQGRRRAAVAERELLQRLRALPDGEQKADDAKRMIERLRTFIGYREYPKYGMISRYQIYKRGLLREAERLVQDGVLRRRDDVFFLGFDEFREVVRSRSVDQALIDERKAAQRSYERLTPPRVLTSDGEAVTGSYRRGDIPADAFVGLPVSSGTIEGRARVITNMGDADLEPGDILVTTHTDPSWSPLFVTIGGLVTEVGGLMTHGAVVAREYGIPAVVGVERATHLIRDGQRVRVDGRDGLVHILAAR